VNWLAAKVRILEGQLSELSQRCIEQDRRTSVDSSWEYDNQLDADGYDKFFMDDLPGTVDVASQTETQTVIVQACASKLDDVLELPEAISTQTDVSLIPDAICIPIFDPFDLLCSLQNAVLKSLMEQMEDRVAQIELDLETPVIVPGSSATLNVDADSFATMCANMIPVLPDSFAIMRADADRYRNELLLHAFHERLTDYNHSTEQLYEICLEETDVIPLVIDGEFSEIALQEYVDVMGYVMGSIVERLLGERPCDGNG